ncbi:MAG: ISLre2 family transposase [Eubacterium sp.]|nr:ISLre2 family transposase [Eubacterium sp.]
MDLDFNLSELEDTIFRAVSEIARNITRMYLEAIDEMLMKERDKIRYEVIRKVQTTLKMKYGVVEYERRYYFDHINKMNVFLLDKLTEGGRLGLYSVGAIDMILKACAEMSYAKAAEQITNNTALTISKTECWNIVQEFNEVIENYLKDLNLDSDKKTIDTLYVEADGVWLYQQMKNHKKGKSMEVKLVTFYEGWTSNNRLRNRTLIGGNCTANEINMKTQTVMDSLYDIDKIEQIILNGDGASWIDNMADGKTIYQLDRFHVMKYIVRAIKNKNVKEQIVSALSVNDIDRLLELIMIYKDSIDDGSDKKQIKLIEETYRYLYNHKDSIIYYYERPEFIRLSEEEIYRNMGVQENQNCSVITMRMKHRRMRWCYSGADSMVKLRCVIQNGWLEQIIRSIDGRYARKKTLIDTEDIIDKTLESAAPHLKAIGTGSRYFEQMNKDLPILDTARSPLVKALRGLSGLA